MSRLSLGLGFPRGASESSSWLEMDWMWSSSISICEYAVPDSAEAGELDRWCADMVVYHKSVIDAFAWWALCVAL